MPSFRGNGGEGDGEVIHYSRVRQLLVLPARPGCMRSATVWTRESVETVLERGQVLFLRVFVGKGISYKHRTKPEAFESFQLG